MSDTKEVNFEKLREKVKKLEEQVETLTPLARSGLAAQAGFDVNDGVTRLLVEQFAASGKELTAESLVSHAEEFGVKPKLAAAPVANSEGEEGEGEEGEEGEKGSDTTVEDGVEQAQSAADKLKAAAAAPDAQPKDKAAEAASQGDWNAAFTHKLAQL